MMECTVEGQEKGEGGEVGNEGEGVMECERQGEGEDGDRETKRLSKFDVECEGERGGEVWGGGEWDVIGEGGEDNNDSEPRTAGEDKGCNDQFSDKKKDAVKKVSSLLCSVFLSLHMVPSLSLSHTHTLTHCPSPSASTLSLILVH